MTHGSLEEKLEAVGSAVEMARNSQIGPYVYPAVPAEFSNWRDEQVAWRETSALFDQSHHMLDLQIEGPDTIELLSRLGVNTFENFTASKAKQLVPCDHDGYVIGDAILFILEENKVRLAGPSLRAQLGPVPRRDRGTTTYRCRGTSAPPSIPRAGVSSTASRSRGPRRCRCSKRRTAGPCPKSSSSTWAISRSMGGRCALCTTECRASPASSCSARGTSGRTSEARSSRPARTSGFGRSAHAPYATNTLESGWIPCPLPAVFTGDEMKAYREWLPADGYEGTGSLGGSFVSDEISDYYLTPHDLGYWPFVKFEHEFVGREALLEMADRRPRWKKVTLAWNGEDVAQAIGLAFREGRSREVHRHPALQLRHLAVRQTCSMTARGSASRPSPATATTSARTCRLRWSTSTSRSAPRSPSSGVGGRRILRSRSSKDTDRLRSARS